MTAIVKADGILRDTKITEKMEIVRHKAGKTLLQQVEPASKEDINGWGDYCNFSVIAKGGESGLTAWGEYCNPTTTLQLCSSESKCECMDTQVIVDLVLRGPYPDLKLALLTWLSNTIGRVISEADLQEASRLVFLRTDFNQSLNECRAVKDSLCVVSAPVGIPDVKCGSSLRCDQLPNVPPILSVTLGHCVSGSGTVFLSWIMLIFSVLVYLISQ